MIPDLVIDRGRKMPEEGHNETRRLAAMMQTDIVGYTALMQRDVALKRYDEVPTELVGPMIDYIEAFRPDREGIPRRYVELEDKLDQLDAYCHAMEAYRGDGD